jgi:hypothetical protein
MSRTSLPRLVAAVVLGLALPFVTFSAEPAALPRTKSPASAKAYIVSPADGATVKGPVTVVFGLKGMGIAPAGIAFEGAGHHHLLVDTALPANTAQPLPATDKILHFGKGQTETTLTLPPGKHTLQLVLGDMLHIPFDPVVASDVVTITVAP